jgi:hypothetical protein
MDSADASATGTWQSALALRPGAREGKISYYAIVRNSNLDPVSVPNVQWTVMLSSEVPSP